MSETNTQTQSAVTADQQLLEKLANPQVQASLNTLVDQLPQLTEMVSTLTKAYSFTKQLATDEVFKNDIVHATSEIVGPVIEGARQIALNAVEAKDRAEQRDEVIGVFGLMKMLKDPQAQKLFRFINAYLEVANERSKK